MSTKPWVHLQIDHASGDYVAQWNQALESVPEQPGVYAWRLRFGVGLGEMMDCPSFYKALDAELTLPTGGLPEVAVRPSFRHGPARIGGGSLSESKQAFLRNRFGAPRSLQYVARFVGELDRFAPPIYVGSSLKLRTRLKEHVAGGTEFAPYMRDVLGRQLTQVGLSYWVIPRELAHPPADAETLVKSLEMIAQIFLAPHAVKSQG